MARRDPKRALFKLDIGLWCGLGKAAVDAAMAHQVGDPALLIRRVRIGCLGVRLAHERTSIWWYLSLFWR